LVNDSYASFSMLFCVEVRTTNERRMIQINFKKLGTGAGDVEGILRIDGKILFYKFNDSKYAQQAMAQMQSKGAIITPGRGWIRVNMFGELVDVKLGNREFNVKETTEKEMEIILKEFYTENYIKAGFLVEVSEK